MRFLRKHRPSPAMVVASISLLVALGGTSVAAVNQLRGEQRRHVAAQEQRRDDAEGQEQRRQRFEDRQQRGRRGEDRRAIAVVTAKIAGNAVTNREDRKRHDPAGRPLGGCQDLRPAGPRRAPRGRQGRQGRQGRATRTRGSLNGPIAVPGTLTTLASLSIPEAGAYALWAKAVIGTPAAVAFRAPLSRARSKRVLTSTSPL